MSIIHWATPYIGTPWRYGATGPEAYDCWNFVRMIQKRHFGVEMMDLSYENDWRIAAELLESSAEKERWECVVTPQEGDVVLMARARLPVHIGTWITANGSPGVLHCVEGAGVVFQRSNVIARHGWGRLTFYRRKAA